MTHLTQGFDKSQRLLTPSSFKKVFDKPIKKIHSQHLLLFVANTEQAHARLGLAITKKKLKKAVDRNTLKRHTRQIFRQQALVLPAYDCVLIVKSGLFLRLDDPWQTIKEELCQMFVVLAQLEKHP